jgi:transposase
MSPQPGLGYDKQFKESILVRMMLPVNEPVSKISEETGISEATLYNWRKASRLNGQATPGNGHISDKWNSSDKFLIVMETYALNETELAEYGRKKGLYKEQIESWRQICEQANGKQTLQSKQLQHDLRAEKERGKQLEKELHKKEKALAVFSASGKCCN